MLEPPPPVRILPPVMYVVPDWLLLPVKNNEPSPVFVKLPAPVMLPEMVMLWPAPKFSVFEPVRDNALPMVSVIALPAVVDEVMIVPFVNASEEPLSV